MDTCPTFYGILLLIVPFACGFNLDTEHPKLFLHRENNTAFGHQVCHFGSRPGDSVLVTDPLRGNSTGGVFRCSYNNGRCEPVHVDVQPGSAFGLSLACSDDRAVVCGPHLVQECEGFNYLNGVCAEFNSDVTISHTVKPAFQECHVILPLDAVILFDDSNSIGEADFKIMIQFIKNIIKAFIKDPRSQVAVAKFSSGTSAIFQFENFASNRDAEKLMSGINQGKGQTHTPSAIRFVLEKMFQEEVGMRNKSQKLLVVITDGKSNEKDAKLEPFIAQAQERGITRFAIGVGSEYSRDELEEIASSPEYVFETKSFSALANILTQLTQRIFTIEGTNVGNSIQLELSQGGFSVALSEEVSVFGAVGAYSWSGGLEEKRPLLNASFVNASNLQEDMTDSYLGYSVAVARVEGSVVYFAGAPRHKHIGTVLGFSRNQGDEDWTVTHRANGSQLGSYFGAELCVLDGLLAVGAPLYYSAGAGGEVTIYTLSTASLNSSGVLRGEVGKTFGRFGSALAALPDLNGDGLLELGVGAPQEEQGKGAVYIFLSKPGGIRAQHNQRVCGSAVNEHLQYFGVSLHSSVDLSSDGLPDVVVGSKGAVTVLRTHPVMCVSVSVTLDPPIISQNVFHCSAPYGINTPVAKATICVNMREDSKGTIQGPFRAAVSLTLELDSDSRPRLLFSPKSRISMWNTTVGTTSVCSTHSIILQNCISDYHAVPLSVKLRVEGETVDGTGGLKPVQNPDCPETFVEQVILEEVCGKDHVCVSDLNVSLSSSVVVDIQDFPVNISVAVGNNGEDAADAELLLHHPSIFSFTRITAESDGHVWCVSNATGPGNITHTSCKLGVSMLRQGMKVHLTMLFRVSEPAVLGDRLTLNASVTSKNEDPQRLHDNSAAVSVPVKQHVNFLLDNYGSTQFIRYDQNTLINHTYKVENLGELSVPIRVEFELQWKISSGFLWDVSLTEDVSSGVKCEKPKLKLCELKNASWHCQNSTCRLIGIQRLTKGQSVIFRFSGHIKSQTKVDGAQVTVVSRGVVSFDGERYSQYNNEDALIRSIETEVEFPAQGRTVLIASLSVFFGLVAVAVIFFVLYKVGFLKSKIPAQQGAGTVVPPGGGGGETPADCLTTETTPDEEIATQQTEKDK